jgi:hypothetical protein
MLDIDVLVWDSQKRYWVKPIILLKQYVKLPSRSNNHQYRYFYQKEMTPHRNKGEKANRMYQFISLRIQRLQNLLCFSLF